PPEPTHQRGHWYNWLLIPKIVSWVRHGDEHRSSGQRLAVVISIVTNLSLLGFFKYFNFAVESYDAVAVWLGQGLGLEWVEPLKLSFRITLPLGISFYTFQSMSYTIDVYRGDARPVRNLIDFACYVSMFPQLVAGPIIRFQEVDDQLRERSHTAEKFARGAAFLALGMAKKVLLANPCGKIADLAFEAGGLTTLQAWIGSISYGFQIYFDFSGYSDMAIGLGLMLGFVFPKNFDSPYHSRSITEFWRRWHLSLSTWLRDYLYLPLGGNRRGSARTYVNLMMVMLLGGLWHGASWNFVIWGLIHGSMLIFERAMGKKAPYRILPGPIPVIITFVVVTFSWVFFRAPDLSTAVNYCATMIGLESAPDSAVLIGGFMNQTYYVLMLLISAVVIWTFPQTWDFTKKLTWPRVLWIFLLFCLSIAALSTQAYNPFIYFIF
ncbi:MAG: MBOAT family O-acyltransferase, partial [Candidatus Sumerlaeota bacterium]